MDASCVAWGGALSALAPAPPVDHAHRPLHCKVSISRYVSLLWSGRVHGPYPLIIAERPSELKPNAAMFHDASRECPPRDPRTLNRTVTGVGGVFRRNRKYLSIRRDQNYTQATRAATQGGRDKMNPRLPLGQGDRIRKKCDCLLMARSAARRVSPSGDRPDVPA